MDFTPRIDRDLRWPLLPSAAKHPVTTHPNRIPPASLALCNTPLVVVKNQTLRQCKTCASLLWGSRWQSLAAWRCEWYHEVRGVPRGAASGITRSTTRGCRKALGAAPPALVPPSQRFRNKALGMPCALPDLTTHAGKKRQWADYGDSLPTRGRGAADPWSGRELPRQSSYGMSSSFGRAFVFKGIPNLNNPCIHGGGVKVCDLAT